MREGRARREAGAPLRAVNGKRGRPRAGMGYWGKVAKRLILVSCFPPAPAPTPRCVLPTLSFISHFSLLVPPTRGSLLVKERSLRRRFCM